MRDNQRMDVRDRINSILEEKGLSSREVSLKAGLSDSMLNKFLTHQTKSITVDNLEKIAKALEVSFRHLMFGDPDDEKLYYIMDRISQKRRAQAIRVLETFADDDERHGGGGAA